MRCCTVIAAEIEYGSMTREHLGLRAATLSFLRIPPSNLQFTSFESEECRIIAGALDDAVTGSIFVPGTRYRHVSGAQAHLHGWHGWARVTSI